MANKPAPHGRRPVFNESGEAVGWRERGSGKPAPDQIPSSPPTKEDWDQVRNAPGRPLTEGQIEGLSIPPALAPTRVNSNAWSPSAEATKARLKNSGTVGDRRPAPTSRKKVYGLWHGGSSYAAPDPSQHAEEFSSIAHARRTFQDRARGSNREYPVVDESSEMQVFLGGNPKDMKDPYPDRIIKRGKRGGTRTEWA